jgi:hypothetical protein
MAPPHTDPFCEQVVGRLDNSAVSAEAAVVAFPFNKVVAVTVPCTTVDSVAPEAAVAMLKVDVQGHEYRVLRGATQLLSRPAPHAPYLVYEEDERLLRANNSSSREILLERQISCLVITLPLSCPSIPTMNRKSHANEDPSFSEILH